MRKSMLLAMTVVLISNPAFTRAGEAGPAASADTCYLFTSFTKNGEDGLHLSWSCDGYTWEALNGGRSYLAPEIGSKEKLMRDPCVTRGPDGTYHLVWTSGWNENNIATPPRGTSFTGRRSRRFP
jgi:hypothetical protein